MPKYRKETVSTTKISLDAVKKTKKLQYTLDDKVDMFFNRK